MNDDGLDAARGILLGCVIGAAMWIPILWVILR